MTRPSIVLSETEANITIIIPFTLNLQALRFPSTIEIKPSEQNGLTDISVALVFHMRAIDNKRMIRKIGVLEESTLKEVDTMLRKILIL
ncbi:MAG: type II toxin-antitoxin system PemK/MazF family toxin [Candidatus Dadabacteria bacterium]|nr:type II toxin-antitoxin system PemK/MazF family toxin [Candidatus Dadabacteria bacterium]